MSYSPLNSGWALEFRTFDPKGGPGMWECVRGRNSVFQAAEVPYADAVFSAILAPATPQILRLDEAPGDMDRGSENHLAIGPRTDGIFCISAEDRRSLPVFSSPKRVLKLLEPAEDLVDTVYEHLPLRKYRLVAGPGALWRLVFAISR